VPTFSENASARLNELLGRPVSGKVITAEHRIVIGQVCADAKASGMSIEQIIIALKAMFDKVPASDGSAHSRLEIRERVIAICIEEYYRDGQSEPAHDARIRPIADGKARVAGDGKSATPTDRLGP
jgi:uncharacterized membrane-anchored protein